MQFQIQREALLKPLRAVSGVVERRHSHPIPILSNVLLHATSEKLTLITTDQEIEMIANSPLEGEVITGRTTVPFRKLMDVCRVLAEGSTLSFKAEEGKLLLTSSNSRFTLATLSADAFPTIEEKATPLSFTLSRSALKKLLEHTSFAMAEQDVRTYLNGLLLEVRDKQLHACSADGHRLAFDVVDLSQSLPQSTRFMLPRKGVFELFKLLDEDGEIQLKVGDNHLKVETSDVAFTCQLLEGRFPDYTRLIPKGDKIVHADRERLRAAFLRASVVLDDKFRGVRLQFDANRLTIAARNSEQDTVEETIAIEYIGPSFTVAFNVKYLLEVLNVLTVEKIKMRFLDANQSALFQGQGLETFHYVVMPMRI